jgi:hypothetical protein
MDTRSVKGRRVKASSAALLEKKDSPKVSGKIVTTKSAHNAVAMPGTSPVEHLAVRPPGFRAHKFRVGQTVLYTSSPITRPGASGTYKVVKLLPSDGDDYQYRIKNPGEAFERVAKESQLELDH